MQTRIVESLRKHPIRGYFERGIIITINTDDPKMFGNSLSGEYKALEVELGFSRKDIQRIILQGIQASWLSEDRKRELIKTFRENPSW
ncbi:Adenosine deaminase [subsurface metagenome]